MSQYIDINLNNGSFLIPCYQYNTDALQSGLAYNTTNLNIQVAIIDGSFYNYTSPNILDATVPSDSGEIGFYQLDPASYIAKIQMSSDIYENLPLESGHNIGMVAVSASGFAPIVLPLTFTPLDVNVVQINNAEVSGVGTVAVDQADIRMAVGLSSANLDTQLADIPTVSEFNARTTPSGDFTEILDRLGFLLARAAGAVPDAQTSSPVYSITRSGDTFTVTLSGVTASGVRTAPTLEKA